MTHISFANDFSAPGLIDRGESAQECAVRELKEETGFTGVVKHISPCEWLLTVVLVVTYLVLLILLNFLYKSGDFGCKVTVTALICDRTSNDLMIFNILRWCAILILAERIPLPPPIVWFLCACGQQKYFRDILMIAGTTIDPGLSNCTLKMVTMEVVVIKICLVFFFPTVPHAELFTRPIFYTEKPGRL